MILAKYLSDEVKLTKLANHNAAGTSPITSSSVDMAGFTGALFFTSFGTAAANNVLVAQQSSDDGSADAFGDLEGTSVASGTSDEDVWLDIINPRKRYLLVVATPGTSSTVESIWCLQYGARALPQDNTTTGTIVGEQHNYPDEGTA